MMSRFIPAPTAMPSRFRLTVAVFGTLLFTANAYPQASTNLAKQGWYADPEIHIFAGRYWIYPTTSDPAPDTNAHRVFNRLQTTLRGRPVVHPSYLLQTSLDAFSSTDLVHWTKHKDVLSVGTVKWAAYAIWAPSAIHLNGKYYLFFAANDIQKNQTNPGGIGEAVSDSPGGPLVDALGHPLIGRFHNGAQPIDPAIFRDTDGSIYFYYGGQGHCEVTRLSADLTHVIPMKDGTLYKDITPPNYVEGPFMVKRKGVYYFMWSEGDWTNSTYGVAYAEGSSPTGPFKPMGKILRTDPKIANGPGHHSVLHIPGAAPGATHEADDWYIVYHRHPLGTTAGDQRVLAIDRMYFDANGDIKPIKMTLQGVGPRLLPAGAQEK
jgi:beta-xylosidase